MRYFYLLILFAFASFASAQDVHFSQWWAAPLAINPSATGQFNGIVRGNFNFRNQWFLIPTQNAISPYRTYEASVDASISSQRLNNNKFGIGAVFYNDKAGDGALVTNSAMISIAYHQSVDRYGKSHLSFGLQGGIVSKQINFQNLVFESQLDGYGWNKTFNNNEPVTNSSFLYPDVNIGVGYHSRPKERFTYGFGFALHHVASPRESFLGNENSRLNRRYVANGSCDISVGNEKEWTISPTFLFMMQGQSQQFNVGMGVNYQTTREELALFFGGFTRINSGALFDAVIINAGVDYHNCRVGLAYDFNLSGLRGASKSQGAMEISAHYIFRKKADAWTDYNMYSPNF